MLSQCSQERCPGQKCVCSPVPGGSSPGSSAVGSAGGCAWDCAEKWIYSTWCHLMLASRSWGEEHCPGQEQTLPGRADVKFVMLKNSLLKVKHLQLRKSFSSTSKGYFLHGSGGLGLFSDF